MRLTTLQCASPHCNVLPIPKEFGARRSDTGHFVTVPLRVAYKYTHFEQIKRVLNIYIRKINPTTVMSHLHTNSMLDVRHNCCVGRVEANLNEICLHTLLACSRHLR